MSKEYAEDKIRQALSAHSNNVALARKQVIDLAYSDPALMKALARPHLDGIVAYQVERVASGRAELEKRHPEQPVPKEGEEFGMDLLRAVAASDAAVFGHEDGAMPKRRIASKQHIEAIHKMASSRHKSPSSALDQKTPYKDV